MDIATKTTANAGETATRNPARRPDGAVRAHRAVPETKPGEDGAASVSGGDRTLARTRRGAPVR